MYTSEICKEVGEFFIKNCSEKFDEKYNSDLKNFEFDKHAVNSVRSSESKDFIEDFFWSLSIKKLHQCDEDDIENILVKINEIREKEWNIRKKVKYEDFLKSFYEKVQKEINGGGKVYTNDHWLIQKYSISESKSNLNHNNSITSKEKSDFYPNLLSYARLQAFINLLLDKQDLNSHLFSLSKFIAERTNNIGRAAFDLITERYSQNKHYPCLKNYCEEIMLFSDPCRSSDDFLIYSDLIQNNYEDLRINIIKMELAQLNEQISEKNDPDSKKILPVLAMLLHECAVILDGVDSLKREPKLKDLIALFGSASLAKDNLNHLNKQDPCDLEKSMMAMNIALTKSKELFTYYGFLENNRDLNKKFLVLFKKIIINISNQLEKEMFVLTEKTDLSLFSNYNNSLIEAGIQIVCPGVLSSQLVYEKKELTDGVYVLLRSQANKIIKSEDLYESYFLIDCIYYQNDCKFLIPEGIDLLNGPIVDGLNLFKQLMKKIRSNFQIVGKASYDLKQNNESYDKAIHNALGMLMLPYTNLLKNFNSIRLNPDLPSVIESLFSAAFYTAKLNAYLYHGNDLVSSSKADQLVQSCNEAKDLLQKSIVAVCESENLAQNTQQDVKIFILKKLMSAQIALSNAIKKYQKILVEQKAALNLHQNTGGILKIQEKTPTPWLLSAQEKEADKTLESILTSFDPAGTIHQYFISRRAEFFTHDNLEGIQVFVRTGLGESITTTLVRGETVSDFKQKVLDEIRSRKIYIGEGVSNINQLKLMSSGKIIESFENFKYHPSCQFVVMTSNMVEITEIYEDLQRLIGSNATLELFKIVSILDKVIDKNQYDSSLGKSKKQFINAFTDFKGKLTTYSQGIETLKNINNRSYLTLFFKEKISICESILSDLEVMNELPKLEGFFELVLLSANQKTELESALTHSDKIDQECLKNIFNKSFELVKKLSDSFEKLNNDNAIAEKIRINFLCKLIMMSKFLEKRLLDIVNDNTLNTRGLIDSLKVKV